MRTEQYEMDVTLKTDGSYFITEGIKVDFLKPRHSIFCTKLGNEKTKVNSGNYQFSYQLTPYHQEKNIIIFITMYFKNKIFTD